MFETMFDTNEDGTPGIPSIIASIGLRFVKFIGNLLKSAGEFLGGLFQKLFSAVSGLFPHDEGGAAPAASATQGAAPAGPVTAPKPALAAAPEREARPVPVTGSPTAPVPKTLAMEELIDGTLGSMTSVKSARELAGVPGIRYFANGTYQAAHESPDSINADSIKQVSVTLGEDTRYFRQIDKADGTQGAGMAATAWLETDANGNTLKDKNGKFDVRVAFQGYTADATAGSNQNEAFNAVAAGKLNPQAVEAALFTDKLLNHNSDVQKEGGKAYISSVSYGGSNLGASNALAAQAVGDLSHVTTASTLLIDPAAASDQRHRLQAALSDTNSSLTHALVQAGYAQGNVLNEGTAFNRDPKVISIRAEGTEVATDSALPVTKALTGKALYQDAGKDAGNNDAGLAALGSTASLSALLTGITRDSQIVGSESDGNGGIRFNVLPASMTAKEVLSK